MSKMITDENGDQVWTNAEGQYHRVDGPAIIWVDGTQEWWVDGKCHRIDGPAIIQTDGYQAWWINYNEITDHVNAWIKENNFPHWSEWEDAHKMMFRLAFSGIPS